MNTIDKSIYKTTKRSWDLTNDLLFKSIFGRGEEGTNTILKDLLNYVLGLEGVDRIEEITIRNSFNLQEVMDDKLSALDIKAETGNKELINIEMQVEKEVDYPQRSLYYWSKLYSSQMKQGGEYGELKPTVGIHFLDFKLKEGLVHGHHKFELYDRKYQTTITKDLEIHYIQMPLLSDIIEAGEDGLAEWITFIKGINKPEMENEILRLTRSKEVMNLAYNYYKSIVSNEEMRERLEAREKFEMDHRSRLSSAYSTGKEEGRDDVIRTMLEKGLSIEQISAMTNVAIEIIESMKTEE